MANKDKPPPPICVLRKDGLFPVTAYDGEEIRAYPHGTEFDLVARTKRSHRQHGTYWKALTKAVDATGRWPNREALHTALKVKLGRVEPIFDLQGRVIGMRPDSTAFDAMSAKDFTDYMTQAMAVLADALGYDPLEWMEAA